MDGMMQVSEQDVYEARERAWVGKYVGEDTCLDDVIASSIDRMSARPRRDRYIDH
jgi:hypothetical protein